MKFIFVDDILNFFLMVDVFVCSFQWNEFFVCVNYEVMVVGMFLIIINWGGNGEVVKYEVNGFVIDSYNKFFLFVKVIDRVFID